MLSTVLGPILAALVALIFGVVVLHVDDHCPALLCRRTLAAEVQALLETSTRRWATAHSPGVWADDPELILADGSVLPRHVALEAAGQAVDAVVFRRAFTPEECEAIVSAVDLSQDGHLTSSSGATAAHQQPRADNSTRRAKLAWVLQYDNDGAELEHGWIHRRVLAHVEMAVRKAEWSWLRPTVAQRVGSDAAQVAHYPLPEARGVEGEDGGGTGGHYDWHIDMDEGFAAMAEAVGSTASNSGGIGGAGSGSFVGRRVSVTVQLSAPEAYSGGHLQLGNRHTATTEQGSLIVFPAYLPHRVTRVTKRLDSISRDTDVADGGRRNSSSVSGGGRHSLVMWLRGAFRDGEGAEALRTAQQRLRSLQRSLKLQQQRRHSPYRSSTVHRSDDPCQCHCASAGAEELCRLHRLEGMLWVHLNESEQAAICFRAAIAAVEHANSCRHDLRAESVAVPAVDTGTNLDLVGAGPANDANMDLVDPGPTSDAWRLTCGCSGPQNDEWSLQLQQELNTAASKCAAKSSLGLGNILAANAAAIDGDHYETAGTLIETLQMYRQAAALLAAADEDGMGRTVVLLAARVCESFKGLIRTKLEERSLGSDESNLGRDTGRWRQVHNACTIVAENK